MKAAIDTMAAAWLPASTSHPGGNAELGAVPDAQSTKLRVGWWTAEGPIFQTGLRAIFAAEPDLEGVGEAVQWSPADAASMAAPHVVLLDADQPESAEQLAPMVGAEQGASAQNGWRKLTGQLRGCRFVMLAANPSAGLRLLASQAGIHWVLNKRSPAADLVTAIRCAYRDVLPPPVLSLLESSQGTDKQTGETEPLGGDLTPRQVDLLQAMAQGLSNQQIADKLGIALPTVKFHVAGIMVKLRADNRTAAVITALKLGIAQLD